MHLRPADMYDASMLLDWRNDAIAREARRNVSRVMLDEYIVWLEVSFADPYQELFIGMDGNNAIGTVRADIQPGEDGVTRELSWTVAPEWRGKGYGKDMVKLLADTYATPVRAEIKEGNIASQRIAEYAGMKFDRQDGDILHFKRGSL